MVDFEKTDEAIEVDKLSIEQEIEWEDFIIGSLLVEEDQERAKKSMTQLNKIERESPNNRAKEKILKIAEISIIKCNGSNVGNIIISSLFEKDGLFDLLKDNLIDNKEAIGFEEFGCLFETFKPTIKSKKLVAENESDLAKNLLNIFLIINEQQRK